jgi:hypothetical protein
MSDLVAHINRVLEVMNLNTLRIRLAPWHKAKVTKEELLSELTENPMDAIRYLYGFKAGTGKSGAQYFRINLAIPSNFSADDVVNRNKNSIMIPGQQSLLKANSQSINPTTIGWFLRSNPMMVDFKDLEMILKALWNVKSGFGLYWAVVRDGDKYNPTTTARAIHIETEEESAARLVALAEKVYGRQFSSRLEDYPLGISMMFVRPFNAVPTKTCGNVKQLAAYQKSNEIMLTSSSWRGEVALDRSIRSDKFESFRHWLMSLSSIKEKPKKDGTMYKDRLFTSIHRSLDKQETLFYFYQSNKAEALQVISALPLMIQEELGLDPGCFFRKTDYAGILEGQWNAVTREYKNKLVINQEQYLQELDDCFLANSAYLPDVVTVEKVVISPEMAKVIAMANGEDDASILSQLTDKTLKEATSRPRKGMTSSTSSVTSVQSGNTSKSKTQAAVKDALKEVSLEHNKAMKEQQQRFQKEIEALRQALDQRADLSLAPSQDAVMEPSSEGDAVHMEDSSDDEEALLHNTRLSRHHLTQPPKSPIHKRPKRSKSSSLRGRGGPSSAPPDVNE